MALSKKMRAKLHDDLQDVEDRIDELHMRIDAVQGAYNVLHKERVDVSWDAVYARLQKLLSRLKDAMAERDALHKRLYS